MARGGGGGSSGRGGSGVVRSGAGRSSRARGPRSGGGNASGPGSKAGILKSLIEALSTAQKAGQGASAAVRSSGLARTSRLSKPKDNTKIAKPKTQMPKPKQDRPVDQRGMKNRNKPLTPAQIAQRRGVAEKVYADDVMTMRAELYDDVMEWYEAIVSEIYDDLEDGESDYDYGEDKSVDDYLVEAWDDMEEELEDGLADIEEMFIEAVKEFLSR